MAGISMKIGYVIVGEDLNSPLLRRQVVELLGEIKSKNPTINIVIINFQGILSILNNMKSLKKLSADLRAVNIEHFVIPNLCPWPLPNIKFKRTVVGWRPYSVWNRFAAKLFSNLALPWLFLFNKIFGCNVFHCRSYVSTLSAIRYKRIFKDLKVIFDPRSDFPEEGVTAGFWDDGSRDFQFWKNNEKQLLENSDAVALIGPTYLNHYKSNSNGLNYFFAPNNVDCSFFKRSLEKRFQIRNQWGVDEAKKVFVYLGALSSDGWHRPEYYLKFYQLLSDAGLLFEMIFLVPEYSRRATEAMFLDLSNIKIICPEYNDVADYLSAADYGMMFFHRRKIAVATKIGEYLCSNLPIIVNANCLGAVEYLQRNSSAGIKVGLGLGDIDDSIDINIDKIREIFGVDVANPAIEYFNIDRVANIYVREYEDI